MTPTLAGIFVFPVKSTAPLALARADVEPRGLAHDRRWLVVDDADRFLTARELPALTRIRATPTPHGLALDAPDMPTIAIATPASPADSTVAIFGDRVRAASAGDDAAAWLSRYLGRTARLVHMGEDVVRPVDPTYAQPGDEVSFADGYPLLIVSQAAVDALNARLAAPVSPLRFRPNLIVSGTAPHAEDGWRRVRIGEVAFEVAKPCVRCVLTTVDFERGAFDPSGEPLRTLIGYRRGPRGVTFGQNLIPRGRGRIAVGDAVEVLA